ncbi:hypothetical protein SLEP1_g23919 [Rubroshorea leprosula]|uniref:Uncharacterized protein n=1 Tax=Rubroshorea leprosula TaxID=152421 RepID=A0AAV5JJX7_9ROSI|nr:hypothetical protein SLEP1_g23919 [Rubroshorea leprosula]
MRSLGFLYPISLSSRQYLEVFYLNSLHFFLPSDLDGDC